MARRGRPRHPDLLTPREWEVLALLQEELSNEEIAQRLAITERTVKFHVSEILGKLGLQSRHEAAAWQPGDRPWWASALAPLTFLWRTVSFRGAVNAISVAGVGVVVATAVGGAVLLGVLVASNGAAREATLVEMEGRAMEPTIPQGALLLLEGEESEGPALARGDIVVFVSPGPGDRLFVKRIVGEPGETVEVRDGVVLIDGVPLDEPYVAEPTAYRYGPEQVPPAHYFVLGDNRNNSSDSHSWGMLPFTNVVGRVLQVREPAAPPTSLP